MAGNLMAMAGDGDVPVRGPIVAQFCDRLSIGGELKFCIHDDEVIVPCFSATRQSPDERQSGTVLHDGIAHGTPGPSQCFGHRGKELCRVKRVISRFVCCEIQPFFQAFLSRIVGKVTGNNHYDMGKRATGDAP